MDVGSNSREGVRQARLFIVGRNDDGEVGGGCGHSYKCSKRLGCWRCNIASRSGNRFDTVLLPCSGVQNIRDLRERKIALLFAVVKMRRDADAGFGTIVNQNFAGEQFSGDCGGVGAIDGDGAGTLGRVCRSTYAPAVRLCAFVQALGHAHGFFANGADADPIQDLKARSAGIERGDMRRAIEKAEGVFAPINRPGFEREWALVGQPASQRRAQGAAQVFAHVEISYAGAAAEPFEYSAYGEIDAELAHVNGDGAGTLKNVENHTRANFMGTLDDGAGVDDVGAAEQDEGNRDEQSGFVDGGEKFVEVEAHVVHGRNNFDARVLADLLVIKILDGGEFQIHHHNFVARAPEIEAGRDHRLREGDILVQGDFSGARADQRGDQVANADGHVPPTFFPSADAAFSPGIGVAAHRVVYGFGHGAERIADQIGGAIQDRKLVTPFEKLIHQSALAIGCCGNESRSTQNNTA